MNRPRVQPLEAAVTRRRAWAMGRAPARPGRRQGGFGLVEMMVAVALGLFLMAGVILVFLDSKQTYRESDAVGRLQENARYAFEILSRDLRAAGYQGCMGSTGSIVNTVNHGASASDSSAWDFSRPVVEGFEATGAGTWSSVTAGTPAVIVTATDIDANVLSGTDVISMRGSDGAGIHITGQPSSGVCSDTSADLKVTVNDLLKDGMVILVSNCTNSALVQITNFNLSQNVVHNTGTGVPGNSTKNMGACFIGGEIMIVSAKSYYIRNNPAGVPSLYRLRKGTDNSGDVREELVEGVENMQIQYGEDTSGDSAADVYRAANAVANWDNVVSVRISLLMRGEENNVVTASQTYTYNGANVTAPDHRIRQVYTTTIAIRNRAY